MIGVGDNGLAGLILLCAIAYGAWKSIGKIFQTIVSGDFISGKFFIAAAALLALGIYCGNSPIWIVVFWGDVFLVYAGCNTGIHAKKEEEES